MTSIRASWKEWAQFLHQHNLQRPVAFFLDAAGPLTMLMAQLIYIGSPLLTSGSLSGEMTKVAQMLEDPFESREFSAFLRKEQTW